MAVEQAVDAFWARGYSATSVRDLTRATGLAAKSLYAEFGDKDALFVVAVDAYAAKHANRYRVRLESGTLGLQRIQSYYESLGGLSDQRGCLLVNSLGEIEVIPPAAVRRIRSFFRWLAELYRTNLEAAVRSGALKRSVDVQELAEALVVFDQGLAIASRSSPAHRRLASIAAQLLEALRS